MQDFRTLSPEEIQILELGGCTAQAWGAVQVSGDFDAKRVRDTAFFGTVRIGSNDSQVAINGLNRPCGIYNAVIADCKIGDHVYICNIGSVIRNYVVEDGVIIEDVSSMFTEEDATFGNGVSIEVLNEIGGREVTLFNEMNAQVAYVQTFYRHDEDFQKKLTQFIDEYVSLQRSKHGHIAASARVQNCGLVKNVNIGAHAVLQGALRLENGTVLSCAEHPSFVGAGVVMDHFILSEGASVDSGAVLSRAFVGQGTKVGKQCSVENSLLFANSEAFHTEICSVFAGPYTVTHHKSTLLIASLWSFYNAGSGTNQSNHMYKLGPVHQGVFERGCKTGSFAYNMMPCHIPAFSVIIGKHMANLDIPIFPFSFIFEEEGKSYMLMGINIFSMGTVRDEEKWLSRDRRKAPIKRDQIIFDVYSPFTVEKMRKGRAILRDLYEKTPREEKSVHYGGVIIKRLLMKKGIRYYTLAIDRYLLGRFFNRIEQQGEQIQTWADVLKRCVMNEGSDQSLTWADVGGLLISEERIKTLMESVRTGDAKDIYGLLSLFEKAHQSYIEDEWGYICCAFEQEYGVKPSSVEPALFLDLVEKYTSVLHSLLVLVLENTKSEFAQSAQISYGMDWGDEERSADFQAVRGTYEGNSVVQTLISEKKRIENRVLNLKKFAESFS
jgi:hypothetical protein